MARPTGEIDGCSTAHQRLASTLETVTDPVAKSPSQLPGWTIGHVLSHLANNAEAMVRRIEGAEQGNQIEQYSGGIQGRSKQIETGARQTTESLIASVTSWSERLDRLFESLPDDSWNLMVSAAGGVTHQISALPFRRWREVEVHHVDLGLGYEPADWGSEFTGRALPKLVAGLPDRSNEAALAAWLLGRGPEPELKPWG